MLSSIRQSSSTYCTSPSTLVFNNFSMALNQVLSSRSSSDSDPPLFTDSDNASLDSTNAARSYKDAKGETLSPLCVCANLHIPCRKLVGTPAFSMYICIL